MAALPLFAGSLLFDVLIPAVSRSTQQSAQVFGGRLPTVVLPKPAGAELRTSGLCNFPTPNTYEYAR